jgi:hypothetical protein
LEALEQQPADLRAHLAPVLEQGVLAGVGTLKQEQPHLYRVIEETGAHSALEAARGFANNVQRLEVLLQVTKEMLRQRSSSADRAVLGDADALAAACYRPILDFAHHHQLPIVSNHPMTLFQRGGTFIELAFLEQQLAPIGLPDRYRIEPWRWPVIAHEIAHDFYASVRDLEQEAISKLDLVRNEDASIKLGDEDFSKLLFETWLSEIFADVVGALMIGPSYLRAMTRIFRNPGAPGNVLAIGLSEDGFIDVHPPRHLRVHVTASFLSRMGFGEETRDMTDLWDQEHGEPEVVIIATPQGRQTIALTPLLELGESIASRLYNTEFRALAGHRLVDIPGLDFSSMHVRRAQKAKPRLAAGQPVPFDARALIAAATEAALDEPDCVAAITEATRLSIVGVGTGERPARVRALATDFRRGARGGASRAARSQQLVAALLLGELLESHTPRRNRNRV